MIPKRALQEKKKKRSKVVSDGGISKQLGRIEWSLAQSGTSRLYQHARLLALTCILDRWSACSFA
jgi:hypothetical protein